MLVITLQPHVYDVIHTTKTIIISTIITEYNTYMHTRMHTDLLIKLQTKFIIQSHSLFIVIYFIFLLPIVTVMLMVFVRFERWVCDKNGIRILMHLFYYYVICAFSHVIVCH